MSAPRPFRFVVPAQTMGADGDKPDFTPEECKTLGERVTALLEGKNDYAKATALTMGLVQSLREWGLTPAECIDIFVQAVGALMGARIETRLVNMSESRPADAMRRAIRPHRRTH